MSSRVFHQVAVKVGVMTVAPAGVAAWLAGPAIGVGAGALMFGFEIWRIRRMVLRAMPDRLNFVASTPAEHDWLDRDGFAGQLAELRALGFVPIADFGLTYPGSPPGFARLLVHPRYRLYAEVSQLRDSSDVAGVATTLSSAMSEGWSLQTSSRSTLATTAAFMRTPRRAWRSIPGASTTELLADHIAMRTEIGRAQRVEVAGDGSVQSYLDAQQAAHVAARGALSWWAVLRGLVRGIRAERRPMDRWLGGARPTSPA